MNSPGEKTPLASTFFPEAADKPASCEFGGLPQKKQ